MPWYLQIALYQSAIMPHITYYFLNVIMSPHLLNHPKGLYTLITRNGQRPKPNPMSKPDFGWFGACEPRLLNQHSPKQSLSSCWLDFWVVWGAALNALALPGNDRNVSGQCKIPSWTYLNYFRQGLSLSLGTSWFANPELGFPGLCPSLVIILSRQFITVQNYTNLPTLITNTFFYSWARFILDV